MKKMVPYISIFIVIINAIVFFYLELTGSTEDYIFLFEKGALSVEAFFNEKRYYCILTCMFMHSGIDHILNNMFMLILLGSYIENKMGRINYLSVYMLSGIFGSVISLLWDLYVTGEYSISVGASGAVYGIMGAFLIFVLSDKKMFAKVGIVRICLFLFVALYCTSVDDTVNYVAHIAGFVFGCVATGLVILFRKMRMKGEVGN